MIYNKYCKESLSKSSSKLIERTENFCLNRSKVKLGKLKQEECLANKSPSHSIIDERISRVMIERDKLLDEDKSKRINKIVSKYLNYNDYKESQKDKLNEIIKKDKGTAQARLHGARENAKYLNELRGAILEELRMHNMNKQKLSQSNREQREAELRVKFREREKSLVSHFTRWQKILKHNKELTEVKYTLRNLLTDQQKSMVSYRRELLANFSMKKENMIQTIQRPNLSTPKINYYNVSNETLKDVSLPELNLTQINN
jgi:hypothetical protein